MLLTMRANIIAGRALNLYTALKLDTAKFSADQGERDTAAKLAELLTPICKAYCTDRGFDGCVVGQQVLGGHGYINEWGQEQNVRDARIAQIYEGTNGIQALDLIGRKTVKNGAEYLAVLIDEIDDFIKNNEGADHLRKSVASLQEVKTAVDELTSNIISRGKADATEIGAASYAYMDLMGLLVFTFMWNRILLAVSSCEPGKYSPDYLDGLTKTADFYFERLLPQYKSLIEEIDAGPQTLMAMSAEQF